MEGCLMCLVLRWLWRLLHYRLQTGGTLRKVKEEDQSMMERRSMEDRGLSMVDQPDLRRIRSFRDGVPVLLLGSVSLTGGGDDFAE